MNLDLWNTQLLHLKTELSILTTGIDHNLSILINMHFVFGLLKFMKTVVCIKRSKTFSASRHGWHPLLTLNLIVASD